MAFQTLLLDVHPPFAYLTLNRPERMNAMNFAMTGELLEAMLQINEMGDVRAVVISGAGGNFCAGGDLSDLQQPGLTPEEQEHIVGRLDTVMRHINQSPKVVITKIQGAALGGGFGLACVSDIAIAATTAEFGMPEVRLGLVPALISPYVIERIGVARARLLMLTGTRFDGVSAHEYGVINEVCPPEILDECVQAVLDQIKLCSPTALAACKQLIHTVTAQSLDESLSYRARLLNTLRLSPEGQEGMAAFRAKRPPTWTEE